MYERERLGVCIWPLHGSAGLHPGHGSCFSYTPFSGDPYVTVSRRLASPFCLSGVPPPGSSVCSPTLSRVGDWGRPPVFQPGSIPGGSVSGGCHRLHHFQGLSVGGAPLTAAVNSRGVTVLRLSSRDLMALSTRRAFFAGSPCSCGRLRMRSLQLCLHRSWDRQDLVDPVYASMECLLDLQCWLHLPRLSLGVPLCQVSPDLHFWSGASDVEWVAHLDRKIASGLWDTHQAAFFP